MNSGSPTGMTSLRKDVYLRFLSLLGMTSGDGMTSECGMTDDKFFFSCPANEGHGMLCPYASIIQGGDRSPKRRKS